MDGKEKVQFQTSGKGGFSTSECLEDYLFSNKTGKSLPIFELIFSKHTYSFTEKQSKELQVGKQIKLLLIVP